MEDQTYTPFFISIHVRKIGGELERVYVGFFSNKTEWLSFPLYGKSKKFKVIYFFIYIMLCDTRSHFIWTDFIQFSVHSNYDDGSDCRIREVSIRGPLLFDS